MRIAKRLAGRIPWPSGILYPVSTYGKGRVVDLDGHLNQQSLKSLVPCPHSLVGVVSPIIRREHSIGLGKER